MSCPPLVLASTSEGRAEVLGRLGIPFEQLDPRIDEEPLKARGMPPEDLVAVLSEAKARAVAERVPGALVLGSDQVCTVDDRVFGKPGSFEAACDQLRQLAGRSHRLLTGLVLLDGRTGEVHHALDIHHITVRTLSDEAIAEYVRRDAPEACAGAYRVESLGMALFESMEGGDYTAVIGLPLTQVCRLLLACGVDPLLPR